MTQRPFTDYPRNEAGLVDNFLGTAYDTVKKVYDNLPLFDKLGEALDHIDEVAEIAVAENIATQMVPVRSELALAIQQANQQASISGQSALASQQSASAAAASAVQAGQVAAVITAEFNDLKAANNAFLTAFDTPAGSNGLGFDMSVTYKPGSVGERIKYILSTGLNKNQKGYMDAMMPQNIGQVDRLNTAIASGIVRIAFVGDSIIEGDRDGLYNNSVVPKVMRVLKEQNPGLNISFGNFSLAGRALANFTNQGYKGIAAPDDGALGFYRPAGTGITGQWPGGSVVGKSWLDHVKDFAPDIVIVLMGANDLEGNGAATAGYLGSMMTYLATWPTPPSVALAPAALCTASHGYQNEIQIAANVYRGFARSRGLTVLDINRLYHLYRYGKDIENPFYIRRDTFSDFPANWVLGQGATFTPSDGIGTALVGGGVAMRKNSTLDLDISAGFIMPRWDTQYGQIFYRSLGSGLTQYTAQVTGNAVMLYYGGTMIGNAVISPAIPNGTNITLGVEVHGCIHRITLNGIPYLNVTDFNQTLPGVYGVGTVGGSGTIYNMTAREGNPAQRGIPELTDADIYGINDYFTNPSTEGGNGINHPTELANSIIWAASFQPLLRHIRGYKPPPAAFATVAPTAAIGTQVFEVAESTVATKIDGNLGYASFVVIPGTNAAYATCTGTRLVTVAATRAVPIGITHSTLGDILPVTLNLTPGKWMITATGNFSKSPAGNRVTSIAANAVQVSA